MERSNEENQIDLTNNNVIIGHQAGQQHNANNSVFIGANAGRYNSGTNNVFLGMTAGGGATSEADQNTFVGTSAGAANTSGYSNVFGGFQTGQKNETGSGNTFLGVRAGRENTTANHNTLIGNNAGGALTTGGSNIFLGSLTGRDLTAGNENTFLGYLSARSMKQGDHNAFLGAYSGQNAEGSGNVFLGYKAGLEAQGDNQLIIANNHAASATLISGDFNSGDIQVKGSVKSNNGGFIFPDGTVQTTAAIAYPENIVKSEVVYKNFENQRVKQSPGWYRTGDLTINIPAPGKVIVTYTGFFEVSANDTETIIYAIGLSNMNSPFDQPLQSNIQFGSEKGTGGFFPFTSRFVYEATKMGELTFSLFMNGLHVLTRLNDGTLHYVPD